MEWKTWLYLLATSGGCFITALYYFQHKLMFFPNVPPGHRTTMLNSSDFGLPEPEQTLLPMHDAVKVQLWMFKQLGFAGATAPTVVFFHGNAGNLSFRMENYKGLFFTSRVNVLAVEYRGFGLSEGEPNETDIRKDSETIMQWLLSRDDINTDKIILFGRSIGGAAALHAAAHDNVRDKISGVIIENTFTCVNDLIDVLMPKLSVFKFLNRNPWRNKDCIDKLSVPLMFISSGQDALIPPSQMKSLYELATQSTHKVWRFYETAGHMNAHTSDGYQSHISDFIQQVFEK